MFLLHQLTHLWSCDQHASDSFTVGLVKRFFQNLGEEKRTVLCTSNWKTKHWKLIYFLQLTKAAMLPLTEFICLRVAYREAFWEELSRLIWRGRSIRPAITVFSTCTIFPQLNRRELVAVFKVSCFPFLNCFASFLFDINFLPARPSRTVYSL